jgi:hybrid cluster-associated redox disulfide protein
MKKDKKITGKTKLSDLMENEKVIEALMEKGIFCLGCPMAYQETLEQGLKAHGMNKKEINEFIGKLNKK